MRHNVKDLIGFGMGATDGEFGKVEEFYFDDDSWTIRYLIVKTGGWLSGRKVLISPAALTVPDLDREIFPVNLSRDQIKNSPDIDTDKPVSRQQEIELRSHYEWPYEGTSGVGFYGGMGMMGMIDSRLPLEDIIANQYQDASAPADPHLRSTAELSGYKIYTLDGEAGKLTDFIIDDQNWSILFLLARQDELFAGEEEILTIPADLIDRVEYADAAVYLKVSTKVLRNGQS